jgi:hypothetical protein
MKSFTLCRSNTIVRENAFTIEFHRSEPSQLIVWAPPDKLEGRSVISAPPLDEPIVKALGELAKACGCDKTDAELARHLCARLVYVDGKHFQWIRALHGFGTAKA